jgi:hypothetical protein
MKNVLKFENVTFNKVFIKNTLWLTADDIGKALGYKSADRLMNLFHKNSDKFSLGMYQLNPTGILDNGISPIFSLQGAYILSVFSRTDSSEDFRHWLADTIANERRIFELTQINEDGLRIDNSIKVLIPSFGRWLVCWDKWDDEVRVINIDHGNIIRGDLFMKLQQDANYVTQILDNFKRRLRITHGEENESILDTPLRDLSLSKSALKPNS